jgi:DNA-binding response OmpR family regulator
MAPAQRKPDRTRRRILVVEDDPDARSLLRMILELDGWLVDTASDGVEAIARLSRELPDVILLDLAMPRLGGWEVLARRAVESTWQRVPVLAMSADHTQAESVLELGADAFLPKPFSVDQLKGELRAVLSRPE